MVYVVATLALVTALQQGPGTPLPDAPGEWRQQLETRVEKGYDVTPGGVAAFNARMAKLANILQAAPVFQPPSGIQPRLRGRWLAPGDCALLATRPCRRDPVRGQLWLNLYWIFSDDNGKAAYGGENLTAADIWVNDPQQSFGGTHYDVLGGPGYLPLPDASWPTSSAPPRFIKFQPRQTGVAGGFPVYDSFLVVIAKPDRPAWVPVSREQYLRALIAHNQRELARIDSQVAQRRDPYAKFVAEREVRRQTMEKVYQQLKKTSPAQAEEYRRKALEMEKGMEAGLKGSAGALAPVGDPQRLHRDIIAGLTAELAGMSPGARASQAWWKRSGDEHEEIYGSHLVPEGTAEARPLVAFNREYFDLSRPTTDWQLIAVVLHWRQYRPDFLAVGKLFEFVGGTSWGRVAGLLR